MDIEQFSKQFRVTIRKIGTGRYKLQCEQNKDRFVHVQKQGSKYFYGTWGKRPFPHAVTGELIPMTDIVCHDYGIEADLVTILSSVISMRRTTHDVMRAGEKLVAAIRDQKYQKQKGKCAYCKKPVPINLATADHKIPRIRGGSDHPTNIVMACGFCNVAKGSMTDEEFRSTRHG